MDLDLAKRKVQKLMAIVKDGRGNEQEAERALAQAEALMRKFGIEEADIGLAQAAAGFDWAHDFAMYGTPKYPAKTVPDWYQYLCVGVARFTDTIARLHFKDGFGGLGFYGERSDVLLAVWLAQYLRDAVWQAATNAPNLSRGEREAFRKAMAGRLQGRLKALRAARDEAFAQAGTGTALVVVNDKLAQRDAHFGAATYGKKKMDLRHAMAVNMGREAGDKVALNRPLSSQPRYVALN